jgi:hypothetical protein
VLGLVILACFFIYSSIIIYLPERTSCAVFHSVDTDGSGYLHKQEVKELIFSIGAVQQSNNMDNTIVQMQRGERRFKGASESDAMSAQVTQLQFSNWCWLRQPSAGAQISTMFLQIAAIIGSTNGFRGCFPARFTLFLSLCSLHPSCLLFST